MYLHILETCCKIVLNYSSSSSGILYFNFICKRQTQKVTRRVSRLRTRLDSRFPFLFCVCNIWCGRCLVVDNLFKFHGAKADSHDEIFGLASVLLSSRKGGRSLWFGRMQIYIFLENVGWYKWLRVSVKSASDENWLMVRISADKRPNGPPRNILIPTNASWGQPPEARTLSSLADLV